MAIIDSAPTASSISADAISPHEKRSELASGVRAMLPWLIGVMPFGMIVGMTARTSEVSTTLGLATGATIYSGSAQLVAIELIDGGAGVPVIVVSVLVINARLLLYGSSIAPHWRGTERRYRAVAAYLLVDPSYAVGMRRYADHGPGGHLHYLAAGVTLWIGWHAAMVAGATLGGGIPEWLALEHAVPLFLLAELVHAVRARPALTAAVVGAVIAVVGTGLPMHSGLLVATVVGVGCAVASERRTS
jgi:predicted branched-subunit amino acid permease